MIKKFCKISKKLVKMHNNNAQKLNFMHENQKQSTKLDKKKVTTLKKWQAVNSPN